MKKLFFAILSIFMLTSCHSKYAGVGISIPVTPAWNADTTGVAFILTKQITRPPIGIAKFPDGGTPIYLFNDADFYYYNVKTKQLSTIADLTPYAKFVKAYRSSYMIKTVINDSLIYYKTNSFYQLKRYINSPDSTEVKELINRASKYHCYNINTKKNTIIDSAIFFTIYNKLKDRNRVQYNTQYAEIDSIVKTLSLSQLGINIDSILSINNREAIDYIIMAKGGYWIQREIYNNTISNLSNKQIDKIISQISKRRNKLKKKANSSYKNKMRFEIYDKYYKKTTKRLETYKTKLKD